jgi:hypothetical protein
MALKISFEIDDLFAELNESVEEKEEYMEDDFCFC